MTKLSLIATLLFTAVAASAGTVTVDFTNTSGTTLPSMTFDVTGTTISNVSLSYGNQTNVPVSEFAGQLPSGACPAITSNSDFYDFLFNCGGGTWGTVPTLVQDRIQPCGPSCDNLQERSRSITLWGWRDSYGDVTDLVVSVWSDWTTVSSAAPNNFAGAGTWSATLPAEAPEPALAIPTACVLAGLVQFRRRR